MKRRAFLQGLLALAAAPKLITGPTVERIDDMAWPVPPAHLGGLARTLPIIFGKPGRLIHCIADGRDMSRFVDGSLIRFVEVGTPEAGVLLRSVTITETQEPPK